MVKDPRTKITCAGCGKRLFDILMDMLAGGVAIETKCRYCGRINRVDLKLP